MRALLTGATGFIGRHVGASLARAGWDVVAGVRSPTTGPWAATYVFDLAQDPIPALNGVKVVFHLAAASDSEGTGDRSHSAYRSLNIEGTRRILAASRAAGVGRFVFFSSVKAVGEGGGGRICADVVPNPTTEYGRSKLEGERMVLHGQYVPEPVVLRLSPVYGPGGCGNLARMIDALSRGTFPPVPETGNRRSMVHVQDVATAARIAAVSDEAVGRSFFVTDGVDYSTRDLYEALAEGLGVRPRRGLPLWVFRTLAAAGDVGAALTGRPMPFDSLAMKKLFGSAYYDITPLERIGFEPRWTLRRALPEILESVTSEGGP